MYRRLIKGLSSLIPSQCAICHQWPSRLLCENCVQAFAQPAPRCETCALQVREGDIHCRECRRNPPILDAALAAVTYGYPWATVIQEYKFQHFTGWATHFALLMRSAPWVELAIDRADWMIPMPLSAIRLQERGFNQALLLSRALDERKTCAGVVLRTIHTAPQSSLHRNERLLALKNAFAIDPKMYPQVQGKRIVIVDDVMTTGASMLGVARALRAAGAVHITGLVFSRTE